MSNEPMYLAANRTVRYEIEDGTALVTLDRPPVNAVTLEVVRDIEECFNRLEDDEGARAAVITGVGECFCAGLDLKVVPAYPPERQRKMLRGVNRMIGRLYGYPLPIVVAVNGHAIAGGLILALTCDYRIAPADPACEIGLTEARAGVPFPLAAMAVWKAEASAGVGRRMVLTARNVSPDEARANGLLDELVPPERVLPRAREVAHYLSSIEPGAYGRIKRQLRAEALERIAAVVASGEDPLAASWIDGEGQEAARGLLASRRGGEPS